nr:hypothetical protein [Tanacetum cinerariifolium]
MASWLWGTGSHGVLGECYGTIQVEYGALYSSLGKKRKSSGKFVLLVRAVGVSLGKRVGMALGNSTDDEGDDDEGKDDDGGDDGDDGKEGHGDDDDEDNDCEEGKENRAVEELIQESLKKQNVDDDKETTDLKKLMEIIPNEEEVAIDVIPLAVESSRIVDWKIYKE